MDLAVQLSKFIENQNTCLFQHLKLYVSIWSQSDSNFGLYSVTRIFEVIKGDNSGSNYLKSLKINRLLRLMTLNTVYKFKVNRILTLASRASTRFFEVIKGHNSGTNYRKSLKIDRLLRLMTLNTVYNLKPIEY